MERYRDNLRFIPCDCGHDKTWHQQTFEGNVGGCEHNLGTDDECKCPKFHNRRFDEAMFKLAKGQK